MNMKVSSHIVDSQEILDSILPLAFFLSLNLGSLFEIFLDLKKKIKLVNILAVV